MSVFRKHLKTHLFSHFFPESPVVPVQWLCHFRHYNPSFTDLFTLCRAPPYPNGLMHVRMSAWLNIACGIVDFSDSVTMVKTNVLLCCALHNWKCTVLNTAIFQVCRGPTSRNGGGAHRHHSCQHSFYVILTSFRSCTISRSKTERAVCFTVLMVERIRRLKWSEVTTGSRSVAAAIPEQRRSLRCFPVCFWPWNRLWPLSACCSPSRCSVAVPCVSCAALQPGYLRDMSWFARMSAFRRASLSSTAASARNYNARKTASV